MGEEGEDVDDRGVGRAARGGRGFAASTVRAEPYRGWLRGLFFLFFCAASREPVARDAIAAVAFSLVRGGDGGEERADSVRGPSPPRFESVCRAIGAIGPGYGARISIPNLRSISVSAVYTRQGLETQTARASAGKEGNFGIARSDACRRR